MEFVIGNRIEVRTVSGTAERIVAGFSEEGAPLFCSPEEWTQARTENREPKGIGWPREYVLRMLSATDGSD